jgi:aryl-alcohol dehydrogenase-like predicted oxidoreductase
VYQSPKGDTNEELVGKAIAKHGRDKFVIATKFGIVLKDGGLAFDSSPANIRAQLADSLKRLGTDYIDLYYQHRQDPATPIEVVAATLKELVAEGKIRYVGYSEITPDELRRAHAIHPVTAIQQEWSLSTRDLEKALVPTARELGVAIVAYSPLGRGLLAQRFTKASELEDGDWRKAGSVPRFSGEHLTKNADAAARLAAIARRLGVPPAQLALAWVHSRGEDVFPIPGTKSAARLEENAGAVALAGRLTKEQIAEIEAAVPEAEGPRYAGTSAAVRRACAMGGGARQPCTPEAAHAYPCSSGCLAPSIIALSPWYCLYLCHLQATLAPGTAAPARRRSARSHPCSAAAGVGGKRVKESHLLRKLRVDVRVRRDGIADDLKLAAPLRSQSVSSSGIPDIDINRDVSVRARP